MSSTRPGAMPTIHVRLATIHAPDYPHVLGALAQPARSYFAYLADWRESVARAAAIREIPAQVPCIRTVNRSIKRWEPAP